MKAPAVGVGSGRTAAFVSGSHPSANPRLLKSAAQLATWGFRVDVYHPSVELARRQEDSELARSGGWRSHEYCRADRSHWDWLCTRLIRKLGMAASNWGAGSYLAFGYGALPLRRLLPRLVRYHLLVGQQEMGMWAACRSIDRGPKVWVDIEDWYSKDLPPDRRRGRPVRLLAALEAEAVARADLCTTTSKALARALRQAYGGRTPTVIYNAFRWQERDAIDGIRKDRGDRRRTSFHWFSQTIGPDRGLESLFEALPAVSAPIEVHLRGKVQSPEWLDGLLRGVGGERVFVHSPVGNSELLSRIAEHDVGLALEAPNCASRDLTVTNKLMLYLLAGLPTIATSTQGQREVIGSRPELGTLVPPEDPAALAAAMTRYASRPVPTEPILAAAESRWCWEAQQDRLRRALTCVLTDQAPPAESLDD